MNPRSIARVVLGGALGVAAIAGSHAQDYPNRPVRVIVPFAPGGGADITGRVIAQKLSESLGQQFIVENRAGAASNIGTEFVARSAPDGYTLLLVGPNHTTNINLFKKLNYHPVKSFEPISQVTAAPYVLLLHPSVPARNLKELIALARSKPGALQKPDVQSRMAALGVEVIGSTPQDFATFIERDIDKWAVAIKASGARID